MRAAVAELAAPALAMGCLAVLAWAGTHPGTTFTRPDSILGWYALPGLGALLALVWLLARPAGRLALVATLVSLALLEAGARVVLRAREPRVETGIADDYYQADPVLGWAPKPGIRTRAWKRVDGRLVYDVEYRIDARGRRVTPLPGPRGDLFLVLSGGSFAFGEGVEDDETLAAGLARTAPAYVPYNYGFHGYGPQHTLARLETGDLRAEVAENRGVFVHLFIDAHVQRAIGSLVVYAGWADAAPYYVLDPGGTPVRRGTLTTGRPLRSVAYSLLGHSALARGLRLDLPTRVRDADLDLTASLLARAADLFRAAFGPERFVVVIYPGSSLAPRLAPRLARRDVEVLDYTTLFAPEDPAYHIPEDWHPSPRAHAALAAALARDLAPVAARRAADPGADAAPGGSAGAVR